MEDPRRRLPDDVLADVLARLSPRSLAMSRCVCREWRAVVDDRRLLRPDLLPLTVGGIFVEPYERVTPEFFARPSVARRVAGKLQSFLRLDVDGGGCYGDDYIDIEDCCNGLLLLEENEVHVVVNPATRRSARLPRCDGLSEGHDHEAISCYYWSCLAFDPTVSPHYEVISMQHPYEYDDFNDESKKRFQGLQWPPPVYIMRAYSSRTGRWEERRFALDHDEGLQNRHRRVTDGARVYGPSAYWRGVLYVHCNSDFILRITLSDDKYQVIDLPTDAKGYDEYESYLGKSKYGIYFAALAILNNTCRVTIWFLDESDGKVQWVFKHSINQHDLITHFSGKPDAAQTDRPWILQDNDSHQEFTLGPAVEVEKNLDWDSDDNESAVEIKDYCDANNTYGFIALFAWLIRQQVSSIFSHSTTSANQIASRTSPMIFGFHPYKEIVFLHSSRVVAYHFSRSKVQDLGELCFKYPNDKIINAAIYTPCWVGDLSENS